MMTREEVSAVYTAEWVAHDFADLRPEFSFIADTLIRVFPNVRNMGHVVDIGCGPGMIIERLAMKWGVGVAGYEGSEHCIAYASPDVRDDIVHASVGEIPDLDPVDLVICTEVAEHLPESEAEGLVRLLCSAGAPILFTAAPPGQDGHHHVNCQGQEYWEELFVKCGAMPDYAKGGELRLRWSSLGRLAHMARNVMVFS